MSQSKDEIKAGCTRFLSLHRPKTARHWLESLANSAVAELPLDLYSEGEAMAALEREVANLLGQEAGVFVIKGVIAQQMALRVWTQRSGVPVVALHPKSHIDLDEQDACTRLHGLQSIRIGSDHKPFQVEDLESVHEPLGAVTVELPLRRAGFKLPTWQELLAISGWCREHKVPLHFDGARLWECASFYGRSYAEIANLADSVYVSFYKGLGGLGGCILTGPKDFIAEAKVWKTRHGGNLWTAFPYVISAQEGLRAHLPKMPHYCERARELALALARIPGVTIVPEPTQTNAFQIYLPGTVEQLERVALQIAEAKHVWLFNMFREAVLPHLSMAEISIGDAFEDFTTEEAAGLVQLLIEGTKQGD